MTLHANVGNEFFAVDDNPDGSIDELAQIFLRADVPA